MEPEIFEIEDVKNEFLQKVAAEYGQVFAPRQLELAMYVLNDFCNNLSANNLVLYRFVEQQFQQAPPQYQQMPFQQGPRPIQQQPIPIQQPRPPQNPFEEDQGYNVRQNINELNRQIQQPPKPRIPEKQLQSQDVDLSPEKPKNFVDNLRAMKSNKRASADEEE